MVLECKNQFLNQERRLFAEVLLNRLDGQKIHILECAEPQALFPPLHLGSGALRVLHGYIELEPQKQAR